MHKAIGVRLADAHVPPLTSVSSNRAGKLTLELGPAWPAARDFFFEKSIEIVHLSCLYSWQSTSRMVRLSEGRRCNLDYSETQSFQDLLLCRSLRLISDELHAGLAGSPRISV